MTSCVYAILAACAVGGPADPASQPPAPVQYAQAMPGYQDAAPGGQGLLARLRRLFGREPEVRMYEVVPGPTMTNLPEVTTPYNGQRPADEQAADEQAEPAPAGERVEVIDSAPGATTAGPGRAPAQPAVGSSLQVAKKYQDQVGHEEDYSWITGHLFYVYGDGGHWVLRYTLPDQVDRYGGSVVLAPAVEMKHFREGDLVCVTGRVINEAQNGHGLGGARYRVDTINVVERADP
jgi:hypothetical protein